MMSLVPLIDSPYMTPAGRAICRWKWWKRHAAPDEQSRIWRFCRLV